ncbi:hypothetical protein [Noviherbaspirillum saxi]|uniref:Uncharacterized protein n=1 Tax=Noviherbaspirillum saxi TaxID=2320863 RepID=A0A3A3G3S9_9BURK|nr:hypothetical protein [Noviherbaspirillum saxi]RJF96076.1 hypothetical protein D3871_22320 [Noviherbaspirillum saxi]
MAQQQDWHTEEYRGIEVHVSPLPRNKNKTSWDYSVRVAERGDDSGSASEVSAQSGDEGVEAGYPSAEAAVEAGFKKGYAMVDAMLA